jgi:hypothetical protein
MTPFPYSWDPNQGTVHFRPFSLRLSPWYISTGTMIPSAITTCFGLVLWEIFTKNRTLSFVQIFILVFAGVSMTVTLAYAVVIALFHGPELDQAFQESVRIRRNISRDLLKKERRTDWDPIGIMQMCIVVFFILCPILMVPLVLLQDLDPLYILFERFIPSYIYNLQGVQTFLIVFRLVVCLFGGVESCRTLSFTTIVYLFFLDLPIKTIRLIQNKTNVSISNPYLFQVQFSIYTGMQLILRCVDKATSTILLFLMYQDMTLAIGSWFATISMMHLIRMPYYLFFPADTVIICFCGMKLLMSGAVCYERSKILITSWKYYASKSLKNRKYFNRKLRGVYPVRINAGMMGFNILFLTRGIVSSFFFAIVIHTMNAVLLIRL